MATRRERLQELQAEGLQIPHSIHQDWDKAIPSRATQDWFWWAYLWDRPTSWNSDLQESVIIAAQNSWDTRSRLVKGQLEVMAERKTREAAEAQQREERAEVQRVARADEVKAGLRRRYLALPGASEVDFETDYPALLSDHRRQEMDRLETEGKRAIVQSIRSSF